MSYQVTLSPSGKQFQVDDQEPLLEAALRQHINLPYGCRNGACGACKATVTKGTVDHGAAQAHALTEADKSAGKTLLCCATARSDTTIAAKEIGGEELPVKTLPARVEQILKPTADVAILTLKLPSTDRLQFRAGQYIDILLKDGQRRSFSMANAPHQADHIELHVRHVPGGQFTDHVFGSLKAREILRINGPHGTFYLREDSTRPIVLLAGGTGFAPIKSIVEHLAHLNANRKCHLYWGARTPADLYLHELAQQWASKGLINYVPVISSPVAGDGWMGRTGLAHEAVLNDFPDLSQHELYACGAPAMIEAARADCVSRSRLPEDRFFADAFTYAPPQPDSREVPRA